MTIVSQVSQAMLTPANVELDDLQTCLSGMYDHKIDFADIFIQGSHHESWVLEDGIIKEGSFNIEQGLGVRAVTGEKTGFAYSDELTLDALRQAANTAKGIAECGHEGQLKVALASDQAKIYVPENPLSAMVEADKIALLREVDAKARELDTRVTQVIVSLSGVYERMVVMATDGTLAADIRPLVRMNCTVLMQDGDKRERGSAGGGGRTNYDYFSETDKRGYKRALGYAHEAIRQAQVNLTAIAAPAGTMPVVLGSGWPGVLLHEAVGHGLEGDFNRKGSSAFSGKVGQQVSSPLCTVVDDGTLAGRRGSVSVDDEGTPGQYNVLIKDGILQGYMQDKLNAGLMNARLTGNGRRESYAHLPLPRMTNTYMLAGESTPEDIISSVEKGIYAPNFAGGQVDITSGKFVFSTSEAYLIENGKLTSPVKGATLIGSGPAAMNHISMVGNDLALDEGVGVCGKDGQSLPVGIGQPTLKVDQLTVGGTSG
ncbi:metalloprotease TldD [Echinimonas agarilytica]|uniref:Metalloprotease TldD n=1 Tax=Echinimonas agarilytica TaxID=1215918 RepID=A0AA41W485_9GAMM|nr:metalloprotease TldD [Echinimonas agarilytica]MCM2678601.1 metalloprotease TldD [Echinimonas agarilytica]